jgi:hypothetical protein
MGLFGKKEAPKELAIPATIIFTCNAIPTHEKATYWFELSINNKVAGSIAQNGIPSTFTTTADKNELALSMCIKENKNGNVTKYPPRKQKLELQDGETARVLFENRRFIIN